MNKEIRKNRFAEIKQKYTKFPNILIFSPALNSTEKTILLYIASFAECHATHDSFANICGVSHSSIKRSLKKLKARSMVEWQFRFGTSNVYRIPPSSTWNLDEAQVTQTSGVGQNRPQPRSQGPTIKEILSSKETDANQSRPLSVGQQVTCIDADAKAPLTYGQVYIIRGSHHRGAIVELEGVEGSFGHLRFELVEASNGNS